MLFHTLQRKVTAPQLDSSVAFNGHAKGAERNRVPRVWSPGGQAIMSNPFRAGFGLARWVHGCWGAVRSCDDLVRKAIGQMA